MSINLVMLSGNITADPELRKSQSDKSVCSFMVATNEGKDKSEFHRCVAWEKTAEVIGQYCKKGNRIALTGRLQTRSWEDKNGDKKYTTEIIVLNVDLPPKEKGNETQPSPSKQPAKASAKIDELEDQIPF